MKGCWVGGGSEENNIHQRRVAVDRFTDCGRELDYAQYSKNNAGEVQSCFCTIDVNMDGDQL